MALSNLIYYCLQKVGCHYFISTEIYILKCDVWGSVCFIVERQTRRIISPEIMTWGSLPKGMWEWIYSNNAVHCYLSRKFQLHSHFNFVKGFIRQSFFSTIINLVNGKVKQRNVHRFECTNFKEPLYHTVHTHSVI